MLRHEFVAVLLALSAILVRYADCPDVANSWACADDCVCVAWVYKANR